MNTAERRERLIRILVLRGHATLGELAMELEVSERTIIRDVDALSITIPLFTVAGRYGGIYIDKNFLKNQPYLKDHEITLLKKILNDIEQTSVCSLNDDELKLLKEIIFVYSRKNRIHT